MAMKFGTGNVNEVVWKDANNNSKVVTAVKFNGSFVYARKGTYTTGTLPIGVGSLAASRTATIEPTAPTNITVSSGGTIYHADTLAFTATPINNLWTVTCSNPSAVLNLLSTTNVSGATLSGVHAIPKPRTVNVTTDPHVSLVTINYYTGTTASSRRVQGDMTDSFNVSAPYTVNWTASYDNYWTGTTSGSSGPATATYSISIQSTGRTYILAAAWSSGIVTFHTSAAAAASGSNPITSATYNSTLYIRQVASNMYFDANGSTVSTKSLVLNTDNFSFSGFATVKNEVLDDPTYYRITINSTMRGDVYYNNTKILSPSLSTQTVYKYKQMGDNNQTSIYAQYVGSMSGSSLLSSSNNNYGTASDNYTSSAKPYTFNRIYDHKTVNFNGGLQPRTINVKLGADDREYTITYADSSSGTLVSKTFSGKYSRSNEITTPTGYALTVWRGQTVSYAARTDGWRDAQSGTIAPGTSTVTITRDIQYPWVLAAREGTVFSPYPGWSAQYSIAAHNGRWMLPIPAGITPTTASSRTGTVGSWTWTVTKGTENIALSLSSSASSTTISYALYSVDAGAPCAPAVYRNMSAGTIVVVNTNNCPIVLKGTITANGASTSVDGTSLTAGASATFNTGVTNPTSLSWVIQARVAASVNWGSTNVGSI